MATSFDDSVVTMQVLEADDSESPTAVSVLDRHVSSPASATRSRRMPPIGKKRSFGGNAMKDPKVHPSRRLKEFPNEELSVSDDGKLVCQACRETLSVKKSTLSSHLKSTKHVESKAQFIETKQPQEMSIVTAIKKHDESKGQALPRPDDMMVYQIKVLKAFLKAGVPVSKLEHLKNILEESAAQLTQHTYMLDLLPFILEEEKAQVKEEIEGKYLTIIFDASDVFAVVVRYVDKWKIHQRLVRMKFLAKCLTGEEIAHQIISTLSVSYGVKPDLLIAAVMDGASVNNAAVGVVKGAYPQIMEMNCFSCTLDPVYDKFNTPILNTFTTYWISLFLHSPNVRVLWKAQTGTAIASLSKTRWSEWEIVRQMTVLFDYIEPFLTSNTDVGPSVRPKLLDILHSTPGVNQLKMELAAVFDIGEHFAKAMYNLDSEGALMVNCYEEIVKLRAVLNTAYHPNIESVAQSLAPGNVIAQQQWISYAMSCVQPGLDCFRDNFGDDANPPLNVFKAMRYFAPARIFEIQPSASDMDSLTALPFLNNSFVIASLKAELPAYLARATDVSIRTDITVWWKKNEELLPNWALAAQKALLMQPSCAAIEKVVSLLNSSFGNGYREQESADYAEASILLQYNER